MVCEVLEVSDRIEESFAKLCPGDRAWVELGSHRGGPPHSLDFDGNDEFHLAHIARPLITADGLGRLQRRQPIEAEALENAADSCR